MTYLLWLDTETTGLSPKGNRLLQVGSIITTPDLKEISRFEEDIFWTGDRFSLHPAVLEMHTKNGLLDRCARAADVQPVLQNLRAFWKKHVNRESDRAYLAGSTVWFDREFLTANGFDPRSLSFMQYRMLDVSTFKVLGDLYGIDKPKSPEAHTCLADLEVSIADLRWWQQQLYRLDENMELVLGGRPDLVDMP